MANNDTSKQWNWSIQYTHYLALQLIVSVLTLATCLYGVTSWCILKKFRNYKNYVFMNVILVNFLLGTTYALEYCLVFDIPAYIKHKGLDILTITYFLQQYFMTAKTHWLVVVSHMFYVDFVRVFNGNVRRKYLKSSLFGWGLSLITTLLFVYSFFNGLLIGFLISRDNLSDSVVLNMIIAFVNFGNQFVPVTINCLFYIIIVFSLLRSFNTSAQTTSNIWRRLCIATLIFILSDVLLLYDYFIQFVFTMSPVVRFFIDALSFSNPLLLDVFIVILRSNRKIWYDFYINRLNQRRVDNDINLRDRTARGSGVSRPVVPDV